MDGSTVHLLSLTRLADWPERLDVASKHAALLMALDGRHVPVSELARVSAKALASGVVVFAVAGPDSERVRQIFSQVHAARSLESGTDARIVTLSAHEEPFELAANRFLSSVRADPEFRASCRACVIATVGMPRPEALSRLDGAPWALAEGA